MPKPQPPDIFFCPGLNLFGDFHNIAQRQGWLYGVLFAPIPCFINSNGNDTSGTPVPITLLCICLLPFVVGVFLGYWVRSTKAIRRRGRAKKAQAAREEEAEREKFSEARILKLQQDKLSRPWSSRLLDTHPESRSHIQETALQKGDQANEQAKATLQSYRTPRERRPIVVEFDDIQNNIPVQLPKPPPPKRIEVLYFTNPNNDGEFRNSEGRENYIEGTSVYKFTLDKSETRAKFEFCPERTSVKMALTNRNELILSVAVELNAYNAHSNRILCEQFGEVILDGAVWKVTSKAKIRYE